MKIRLLLILFLLLFNFGCGGGGSSSQNQVDDIGPIVSVIEGYVYIPASTALSPSNKNLLVNYIENNEIYKNNSNEIQINNINKSPQGIVPTAGYVPLVGATVQLSGTNKAQITDSKGYFRFAIGQKETLAFGNKKIMINKSESNVSIEFEVNVVSGDNKYIHTEINTKTGEKTIKEVLTNRVQSPFIFVSGKVISATGNAISNAEVTATKVTDTSFVKKVFTDTYGRYSFTDLTDGLYTLTVEKTNFKTSSKNVEVSSSYTLSNIDFVIPGTFAVSPRTITPELTSVKIVYSTSVPTSYVIEYGLTSTYTYTSVSNLFNITNEITLTNLSPKTVYHYKIKMIDQYGNTITTNDETFETLDPNTNIKDAPIVNSNYIIRKTHNSITVTFNTNMSAYGQIEYKISSSSVYERYPADGSEIGPQTNFEIEVPNLLNSTTYDLFILVKNAGNKNVSRREPQQLPIKVTTDNSPDVTPPVVSNVTITDIKSKEATIKFNAIDIHEGIRNNTNAMIYYGISSYPTLQYDYSVVPPKVRLDYYHKISEALSYSYDAEKTIRLTGLEPSKRYYFRPVAIDPSGNIGTTTEELSFETKAPGSNLIFSLSESPEAGQVTIGEHAKILRLVIKGSTEENVIIKRITFKQTGSIPYNAIDKLTVTDGVNTWTVNTPVSSNIEVRFDEPKLTIPKNTSIYLTISMTMNTGALNLGGTPRNVKLKVENNSSLDTNIEAIGDIYGSYVQEHILGLPLESNPQEINIGQLKLSQSNDATDSNATFLVNRGQKDVTIFKFKVEALYEDVYINKVQLNQIGNAVAEADFSNVRLYDGVTSLAVGETSGGDILFQSTSGLIKIPKGTINSKVISVVADIQHGAVDARYLKMKIDKIGISGSGFYSKQNIEVIGINTPIESSKFTIGDSALIVSKTLDSPIKQTFTIGDTNKTFTIFQILAGSAEDIRINKIDLTFQGTATFSSGQITLVDENNTIIFNKVIGGGGLSSEASYDVNSKKFTIIPQSTLIIPKGSFKKIYVKGNISSTTFEVGKTIQISVANDGDITGIGVQTNSDKSAIGNAIGSEHSIIGGITLEPVTPQPSNILAPGSKYNNTPNNNTFLKFKIIPLGESVTVQSFNFEFNGTYSILENLRVIEYIDANNTQEVAINPVISGSIITLTPQSVVNITTTGKEFHLVGDISISAPANSYVQFNILKDGHIVSGVNSKQVYKTQETVNGNKMTVTSELFYVMSSLRITPETMMIGDTTLQEVFSFRFEAKPRTGYYIEKITLNQLGTATFGINQDFLVDDFQLFKTGDGITLTPVNATITLSGVNLLIQIPQNELSIDATSLAANSQYLTCVLKCKSLKTAFAGKTLRFYLDDNLITAKSITSGNILNGGSQTSILGTPVTLQLGNLKVQSRSDNPASTNITNSNQTDFLTFDILAENEDIEINSIVVTLDIKDGLLTDFDSNSLKISVNNTPYPNSVITSLGNKFIIEPLDNSTPTPKLLKITKNTSAKITLSGKVNYINAQNNSKISLNIASNNDILGTGVFSTQNIYSVGTILGNYMTIVKSPSTLTVTLDSTNPSGTNLTNTSLTDFLKVRLTSGSNENVKINKVSVTYDGNTNNIDANAIQFSFGAPISKTYTIPDITFNNNVFTLEVPQSDNIEINPTGVVLTVSGKRTQNAFSGQQFFFRIAADGDIIGNGVNSNLPILSTGTLIGNKFTIDMPNTSILSALNVAFTSDNPSAQTIASGQKILVAKFDLQTKRYVTSNFVDSVRINTIELSQGGTLQPSDITKWELTDGTNTFTISNPLSTTIKFDNMNYVVPIPTTDSNIFSSQKQLFCYVTTKNSVKNKTVSVSITATNKILALGALYGNNTTISLASTPLTSNQMTLDNGTLNISKVSSINDTTGSANLGDVGVELLGFTVLNNVGSGGSTSSPEDVYITNLKITNLGTASLGTDVDSLKLYEKDGVTETFIANAVLMTDPNTNQKYFQFSDNRLYKVSKNAAAKTLVLKANVPATATYGKTIRLSLVGSDITATGADSNAQIQATGSDLPLSGKNVVIGSNSLVVSLDATSPSETTFYPDEDERVVAVFKVKTGTGEGVTLNLSSKSFEYSGSIPQTEFQSVKLRYNNTDYPLTASGTIYTTNTPITLSNNTEALFSIVVKLKPNPTLTAGNYIEFRLLGAGNSMLTGISSVTTTTINSTNGTPVPTSNRFIAIGKITLENDSTSPSGNIVIGGNNINIFKFKLTPTLENATVSSIKVKLSKGSFTTDLENLILSNSADTTTWNGSIDGNYVTFKNMNFTLSAPTTFIVSANIKQTAQVNTKILMQIENATDIVATGTSSNKTIIPTGSASGNELTLSNGSLSISLSNYYQHVNDIIIGGTKQPATGVLFTIVKLTASNNENIKITEVKFNVEGTMIVDDDFGNTSPYNFWLATASGNNTWGSDINGLTATKNGNIITFTGNPIINISSGTDYHLVIGGTPKKPDATSNRQGKIVIESGWIKGVGVTSNKTITSTGTINYNSGNMSTLINGILNAFVGTNSPSSLTILASQSNVTIAEFDLKSALSSNNNQIEDIKLTRIEIYTSCSYSNFSSAPKIQIDGNTYTRNSSLSNENTHVFDTFTPQVTLNKDASAKTVKVLIDTASSVSGKVYAKLISSGTKGEGVTSSKGITCSTSDLTGSEHIFGNAQLTLTKNANLTPLSQFINIQSGDLTVMGIDANVSNVEDLLINNNGTIKLKLEGSINKEAITRLKIQDNQTTPSTWLDTGANSNPFNNSSQTYVGNFTGTATLTKNTTTPFKIILTIDETKVNDGDTLKLSINDSEMIVKGSQSNQNIQSVNDISHTLILQKTFVTFTQNSYLTGNYKRGDTNKTIIDFNISAGKYQDIKVSKIYLTNNASNPKTSFNLSTNPEINNFKVYIDDILYTGAISATNEDKNGANINYIKLTLNPAITIFKGSYKRFKINCDFTNNAVNGSKIKAYTEASYYNLNDFDPVIPSGNIIGSASGNEHTIQVFEIVDISLDTTSPTSSNITLTPIYHNESTGNYGHIATYKLKCSGENATLTKVKLLYTGSNIEDISSLEAYVGTSTSYSVGTKFTSHTVDKTNNKIVFTHSGISLTTNTDYYLKIGAKVPNSPTVPVPGRIVRLALNTNNDDYPPVEFLNPVKGNSSGNVTDFIFNITNITSNPIYISSSEVNVKVGSENLADVSLVFNGNNPLIDHKVMEITISNTPYSDYTLDKIELEIKQDGENRVPFDMLVSSMSLSAYLGSEKVADANVSYNLGKTVGTFTLSNFTTSAKTFLKGQSKKFDIKLSTGSFLGIESPKIIFAIKGISGTHTIGGSSVKGTEYIRIPSNPLKNFYWIVGNITVSNVNDSTALITAASSSSKLIIRLINNISLNNTLNISGGQKTIDLNNYTLTITGFDANVLTDVMFKNGTVIIDSGRNLINAGKVINIASNCTFYNKGTINNVSNGNGTIINNGTLNNYEGTSFGTIINSSGSYYGTIYNYGTFNLLGGTFTNVNATLVNAGVVQSNLNLVGNIYADGNNITFDGTGTITTLTLDRKVGKLTINCPVTTLQFNGGNINSLIINNTITNLSGSSGSIDTLTYNTSGTSGSWPNGILISKIDQSNVATNKTINLGTNSSSITEIKGHSVNLLTLQNGSLASAILTSGNIDISSLNSSNFIISANAPLNVTATGKNISQVNGNTLITINGANFVSITNTNSVDNLTLTGTITTLSIDGIVKTLNVNGIITDSTINLNSSSTQNINIAAVGQLNRGSGSGILVNNVTSAHYINFVNGSRIYQTGGTTGTYPITLPSGATISSGTIAGITLGGTAPNATLIGTATGNVKVTISATSGNISIGTP